MRAGLALFAGLLLMASPAHAQAKTQVSPAQEAVAALEVCETFARGDVMALDDATAAGWDAYDNEGESPFVRSYGASKEIPGIGWGDIFVLFETYPDRTLGYCRLDVSGPKGKGEAAIDAIAELDRYEGEVKKEDDGSYASLISDDGHSVLLSHWNADTFVIQLTTITPKAADSAQ